MFKKKEQWKHKKQETQYFIAGFDIAYYLSMHRMQGEKHDYKKTNQLVLFSEKINR